MSLAPFALHRPGTVEEAGELLARHGEDAAILCGGTELLLLLKLGVAAFGHVVDVKGIGELAGVRLDDGHLAIGATVTHRALERSRLVAERLPALAAMERGVANVRVRSVGTLGGNLCFSDPHSDPAAFLLALDAQVECRVGGEPPRRLPLSSFLTGPWRTALRDGELLVSVRVPLPPAELAVVHEKFVVRERPLAVVTCAVRTAAGAVAEARVAVGAVGSVAVRAVAAERRLLGVPADAIDEALRETGEAAAQAAGPVSDSNGSADYKANLVRVLVERGLRRALAGAA